MRSPLPSSEVERRAGLAGHDILADGSSAPLDALVECARRLLDMPIAAMSLIGENRRWHGVTVGMDMVDAAHEHAFWGATILGSDLLVVEDASIDPHFCDNALVANGPRIRFYAGAPLTVRTGEAIGRICVMDTRPRKVTQEQICLLRQLSVVATALIDSHRATTRSLGIAVEADLDGRRTEDRSRDLLVRERQFRQSEALARVGSWEFDLDSKRVAWSDEACRICEIPPGTIVTLDLVTSLLSEAERQRVGALIERALADGVGCSGEFEIITPTGAVKQLRAAADVEHVAGVPRRLFGILQDVSNRQVASAELWHAANHDALTGLANRASFNAQVAEIFATGPSAGAGLLMIDVDHLKEVNDTLGHKAGDVLLQAVAERLSRVAACAGATVARIGGDEFAIAMERTCSSRQLADLGHAVRAGMHGPIVFEGHTLAPRVSIGGAVAEPGDTGDTLRQKADLALYESKRHRRGDYAEFREEMRSAIFHRIGMIKSVDDALSEFRLEPYYQPVVRLDTAEIVGLEALARIRTPDGRIVAAGAFHEAFEEPRIAHKVTGQMMARIAADIRSWLDGGFPLQRVGINVTGADFAAGDLCSRMSDAFGREGVSLDHVVLEVTETVFMNGHERAVVRAVEKLRSQGVVVALDDFGTGFASLTHLRSLPVDIIKIDKSFVDGMLVDRTSGPIVEALLDLGRKLGLRIVAEGIETIGQAEHLKALGCGLGQGYLFARPGSADTTLTLLTKFGQHRDRMRQPIPAAHRSA